MFVCKINFDSSFCKIRPSDSSEPIPFDFFSHRIHPVIHSRRFLSALCFAESAQTIHLKDSLCLLLDSDPLPDGGLLYNHMLDRHNIICCPFPPCNHRILRIF